MQQFDSMLQTAKILFDNWKNIPILKNKDKEAIASNCRPITGSQTMFKLFTGVITNPIQKLSPKNKKKTVKSLWIKGSTADEFAYVMDRLKGGL